MHTIEIEEVVEKAFKWGQFWASFYPESVPQISYKLYKKEWWWWWEVVVVVELVMTVVMDGDDSGTYILVMSDDWHCVIIWTKN